MKPLNRWLGARQLARAERRMPLTQTQVQYGGHGAVQVQAGGRLLVTDGTAAPSAGEYAAALRRIEALERREAALQRTAGLATTRAAHTEANFDGLLADLDDLADRLLLPDVRDLHDLYAALRRQRPTATPRSAT